MLDRNELWAQAAELGQLLAESPQVLAYQAAEAKLQEKPVIRNLMNRLKDLQEQYGNLSQYGSGPHLKSLEESMEDLVRQLDQFPEVQEYKEAMQQVDQLLRDVTQLLAGTLQSGS